MNNPDMTVKIKSIKSRIEILIQDGHLSEAAALLDQLYEKIPEDIDICSMRAIVLILENELDLAETVLKDGLKRDSIIFALLFTLAYISELRGQLQQAADLYLKASSAAISDEQKQSVSQAIDKLKAIDNTVTARERLKIVFFVKEGMDSFLGGIIEGLDSKYWVRKMIVRDFTQVDEGMKWADICWFEWCDELVIYGSKHQMAEQKKIICRLHSYEAFTDYPDKVNWTNVDKVIFVAEHIKNYLLEKNGCIKNDRTIIIPNGINVDKYAFKQREPGYNIAYVGYINYKKGPMLLLHVFKAIFDKDSRYKLYIAGKYQDARYELYFKQMVKELGMQSNVFFEGWQENIDKWLEDKNYIISTSLLEGNPVGIMEAMSQGIKPVIHNFVGARRMYPAKYVWNTINEAVDMVISDRYDSFEYHDFVKDKFSLDLQLKRVDLMISDIAMKVNNSSSTVPNCSAGAIERSGNNSENPVVNYYNNFLSYLKNDRMRTNPRHEYLKRNLSSIIKPDYKVLDLGCGIGITTEHIKSLGVSKVIGVDLSPELIRYARETVKGIEFIVHDITSLDLSEEFDVISLCDVVEHVPMDLYGDLFKTIRKHLKAQGLVYMSIPDFEFQNFIRKNRPDLMQIIDNSISYSMIDQLCERNGLKIKFFNIYGIDLDNQYNEYLLCNREYFGASWDSLKK
jgi:glycosyltransferase involved in cell wall biosynthesis/2-polyprenyl-3-methyl-5-hydroxy-6-metoxy-1,4-benzoquinol methylase